MSSFYKKDVEDALNDAILELYKAQTKLNHALYTWLVYLGFPDDIKARFSIKFNLDRDDDALIVYKDDDGEVSLSFRSLLLLPRIGVIKYFNIKELLLEN
jgi:hypothetical protein